MEPSHSEQFTVDGSRDLLESDRRYFEAGAELIPVPGAVIAATRGLEALASGCVVQRVDSTSAARQPDRWLTEVESKVCRVGTSLVRIYLDSRNAELEGALTRRGYRRRVEYGLVRDAGGDGAGRIDLRSAEDEDGWAERRELMRRVSHSPDGHDADADLWIELERRKHAAGYMRPYLVFVDDAVVAAVSSAASGSLLRIKNVAVDPAHRRKGIATGIVARFGRLAAEQGFAAAGCFVLEGEPGLVAYPRAGYRIVTEQTEWSRRLTE
jgi:GNAT superfamily N-acetyltransferase